MDYYDELGVDSGATSAQIKKAYKKKAMDAHPDRGGSNDEFDSITKSVDVLLSPNRRAYYDRHGVDMDIDEDAVLKAILDAIFNLTVPDHYYAPIQILTNGINKTELLLSISNARKQSLQSDMDKINSSKEATEVGTIMKGFSKLMDKLISEGGALEHELSLGNKLIKEFGIIERILGRKIMFTDAGIIHAHVGSTTTSTYTASQ